MTGFDEFSKTSFFNLTPAQNLIMLSLKLAVIASVLLLAWRRRKLAPPALFATLGYAWFIFFIVSPAIAVQYFVWLAPFILFLSPTFYGFLVVATSVFLVAFYTITSGGFPWYFAHASNKNSTVLSHWSVVPWITLLIGSIVLAYRSRRRFPEVRLASLATLTERAEQK
jgi:hypothetical protein